MTSDPNKNADVARAHGILRENAIPYTVKNNGIHFVVLNKIDFWPTTGKYIFHHRKIEGKGIFNLLRELK